MPKENDHFIHAYLKKKKIPHLMAEEAAGIGILAVILGVLLLLTCWYCKRRSGYKILKDKKLGAGTGNALMGNYYQDKGILPVSKGPFQENNNYNSMVPNAPPAYEKFSAEQSPPPYAP
ncbi:melanoma antigen recognized by T-cells 1 isoform X2 [Sarcophilus harrisii]|uniref:Melan-A n=1 Tax=Sarcophilus harrisii TaxID=9305 RepID=G3VV60_SARHA|nr:melanoma antigen recognized by T-cells 1 isoform X2 [Sarcophilus harrisii]XP_031817865.1 melanoma antigen recognized by T-cells 1 isoform X2 [Sarcophilus harrisii]